MLSARALIFTARAVKTRFGKNVPLILSVSALDYASIFKKSKKTVNSQKRNKEIHKQ